jgi:hypothetical protein
MSGTVTISKRNYERLCADSDTLARLEANGVDNWDGYSLGLEDEEDDLDEDED